MPAGGGLERVFERIRSVDGESLQLFTRNQRQWLAKPVEDAESDRFRAALAEWGRPAERMASHASYLINLASPKDELWGKSVAALAEEAARCVKLGVPYVVLHPGAHTGSGAEAGVERVAAGLDKVLEAAPEGVAVLLENTAGQGSALGSTPRELGAIIATSRCSERLGICLDTAHAFAAGYDLRAAEGLEGLLAEVREHVGLERLRFVHANDSLREMGSNKDRHAHIGEGEIGLEGFGLLVNHPALDGLPVVLETPKDEDLEDDRRGIAALRSLLRTRPEGR